MTYSLFDGKIVAVTGITQEMLNWLEESNILYTTAPHLVRVKYSGPPVPPDPLMEIKGGPNHNSDFKQRGHDIMFDKEDDRMHFQLRFGEDIITRDDPFEF